METPFHSIVTLFDQLGLDSSDSAIDDFISKHKPLPAAMELSKADFWNPSQAAFLTQVKEEDADWVEIVDQLDAMLR